MPTTTPNSNTLTPGVFEKFGQVDDYVTNHLVPQDASLLSTLRKNEEEGLDAIDVSPNDGKFLYLLCKMNKVKRVLEIGTLGGYSAIVSTIHFLLCGRGEEMRVACRLGY